MIAMFTSAARSDLKTLESIATPCSVKAIAEYRLPPQLKLEVPIWHLKFGLGRKPLHYDGFYGAGGGDAFQRVEVGSGGGREHRDHEDVCEVAKVDGLQPGTGAKDCRNGKKV